MNPLRTFRLVPLPTAVTAAPAIAMWCVWWLSDQLSPVVAGAILAPVALALLARFVVRAIINVTINRHARGLWKTSRGPMMWATLSVLALPLAALMFGSDRIAQIGLTLYVAFQGVSILWFVVFSPQDLHQMPNAFAREHDHLVGAQTLVAIGHLILALTSAALIGHGAVALWVALMSGGALIYYFLVDWVVILWILVRSDNARG